jgi:hypothetical protein
MIAELRRTYCAVRCVICREPIPVSEKVVRLLDEVERGDANVPRSFVTRCKACEFESVYLLSDLPVFTGFPRRPALRTRAA